MGNMEETVDKFEPFNQQTTADPGNATATAETILNKGTEAYGKAEKAVSEAYDKTTRKAKQTYEQAKNYSTKNPGKTILVALGIGVGVGLLLRASCSRRARPGLIA